MYFSKNVCITLMVLPLALACGREDPERSQTKVVNGTIDDSNLDRDGVNLATVRLWTQRDGRLSYCTATRISTDSFLTAAHCFANAGDIEGLYIKGGFANTFDEFSDSYTLTEVSPHPQYSNAAKYDIALFRISSLEVNRLGRVGIARVSFNKATYHQKADMYGYGCAFPETTPDGHKRYGTAVLADPSALAAEFRYVNITPAQGFDPTEAKLCSGDSGGPLVQGGKVIGVNSGIRSDYSFFARLDFNDVKTWYSDFVARN